MARQAFRLDRRGVGEVLKSQGTTQLINTVAAQVRDAVDVDDDVEVTMEPYTTDRGAASVAIEDPRGLELQATDGALTRAAAKVGLDVVAEL